MKQETYHYNKSSASAYFGWLFQKYTYIWRFYIKIDYLLIFLNVIAVLKPYNLSLSRIIHFLCVSFPLFIIDFFGHKQTVELHIIWKITKSCQLEPFSFVLHLWALLAYRCTVGIFYIIVCIWSYAQARGAIIF